LPRTTELVQQLRGNGVTYAAIGERLGVHWRTVYRWGREEHLPWGSNAIDNALERILADPPIDSSIVATTN